LTSQSDAKAENFAQAKAYASVDTTETQFGHNYWNIGNARAVVLSVIRVTHSSNSAPTHQRRRKGRGKKRENGRKRGKEEEEERK
jgi:hypothetical protein